MAEPSEVRSPFAGREVWLVEGDRARHEETWRRLDPRYDGSGPCGVLTLLDAPDPAAEWHDPRTVFAGFVADGRQVRVAWFSAAVTKRVTGWTPDGPPYRVLPFADQAEVAPADVTGMWLRERALDETEAHRRVQELLLVAIADDGGPAGVATAYLAHHSQTHMDLWHVRVFVTAPHRRSTMATALTVAARDRLADAFTSGRDTRGAGIAFDVVNAHLLSSLRAPVWNGTQVVLIGTHPGSEEIRVFYFPGPQAPQGSA